MLINKRIKELINNREIEISVSFEKKNDIISKCDSEKNLLSSSLKDNLYSDRLKLTMGPIVKILNNKSISPKYRFKTLKDCHDLRSSGHKYIINPGESIIILTNERIKLNNKYACLVVPRISLSDVGIVVTTAYVDAYYNGIMRLHLSNLSDKPYELHTLEAIAQCFFFELSAPVSEDFKDKFSTKSVFFGQTWEGILDSDRNPFPTKKVTPFIDRFKNIKHQLSVICSFVKKHSLIFLLLINFAIIVSGYIVIKDNFTEHTAITNQIKKSFTPSSSEIVIEPGKLYGEKAIIIDCSKGDIVTVLCNNDNITYRILSGSKENETKLVFSTTVLTTSTEEQEINFTYIVIKGFE